MSIQLNYSTKSELELVEYPGMVVNVDKMLDTLGGVMKISQALSGDQRCLELRFHPENPFNKVLCSNSGAATAGLLLSIKVRRSKKNPTRPPQYFVRILGRINKIYQFENMCDFQYLPLFKMGKSEPTHKFGLNVLMPENAIDTNFFARSDIHSFCMPQVFARSDTVHTGIFRKDKQEDGQQEVLGVLQKSNYDSRDVVSFNMIDTFPTCADPQIIKRMKVKYVSDEQLERVKKLFDQCPIWTRIALLYESGVSNDKLKCISSSLAYYFSTGPWRTLYVRYGYDPRKDFKSRYFQTFDFRLRFRSGVAEFVSNKKESMKRKQENPYEAPHALTQDVAYPYLEENKLPRSRQCILRYCDIRIPKIQEMLDKIPTPLTGAICNERTGWLPVGFDAQIRQIISSSITDLLRNYCRKENLGDDCELDAVVNEDQENDDGEKDSQSEEDNEDLDNIGNVMDAMEFDSD